MTNTPLPMNNTFRGEFASVSDTGQKFLYSRGDVVLFEGKAFIAAAAISGLSPDLSSDWIPWGSERISFRSTAPPDPQVGDSWVNSATGKRYSYFGDGDTKQWVEF